MKKETIIRLADKYGMEPYLSDAVTREQIGYYIMSESLIPELDAIIDEQEKAAAPATVVVNREFLLGVYRYVILPPQSWRL